MADGTEAGMWLERAYKKDRNCVYVGAYPAGSLLELAPRDAVIEFHGASAWRVGAKEGEAVPVSRILEKMK